MDDKSQQDGKDKLTRWTEMKKCRAALEHLVDWEELSGAELRKLQRDGRERKEELVKRKKKKFQSRRCDVFT